MQWKGSGSANLFDFIGNDLFNRSIVVFDTKQGYKIPQQTINAVFNQIADPDTHKITLSKADEFYRHIPKTHSFFQYPFGSDENNTGQYLQIVPRD